VERSDFGQTPGLEAQYHVRPVDAGWQVLRGDIGLAAYPTKERAVDVAEELTRRFGNAPVIVHDDK
jgi:hypothetical protein